MKDPPTTDTAPPSSVAEHSEKEVPASTVSGEKSPQWIAPPRADRQRANEEFDTWRRVKEALALTPPPAAVASQSVKVLDEILMTLEYMLPFELANDSPWIAPPDPPDEQLEKVESITSSCEPCKKNVAPDKVL